MTKLFLSDEPAAGLDPVFRKDFFKLLQEFVSEYQATILVSDNIEENLDQITDFIITIENGKSSNIFKKYKFIPVDIKQLLFAKSILLSKYIMKQVLPVQIITFIAKIIYTHIYSGRFFNIQLFIPLIPGILTWIIIFTIMYISHNIYKI